MHAHRRTVSSALVATAALALACTSANKGPAQLQLGLAAPAGAALAATAVRTGGPTNPPVDAIVVNVVKVTAHSAAGGWTTVGPASGPVAVNLLDLPASAVPLGLVTLPAGKITQVRLVLGADGNYVVPAGSTTHAPLTVPSGLESGVKIQGPWDVSDCSRLSLALVFDGKRSIEYHPANGTWILRPVIRPLSAGSTPISCEPPAPPPPPPATCGVEAPCAEGEACVSGACVAAEPLPAASACGVGPECLSGSCVEGACAPGASGAPCAAAGDCLSLSCVAGACAEPAAAAGAGQTCASNAGCLSANCTEGVCVAGLQGDACRVAGDCFSGLCGGTTCTVAY